MKLSKQQQALYDQRVVGAGLPIGIFDFSCSGLHWEDKTVGQAKYWSAEIPYDRSEDCVKGEQQRCDCEWTRAATGTNENATNGKKVLSGSLFLIAHGLITGWGNGRRKEFGCRV